MHGLPRTSALITNVQRRTRYIITSDAKPHHGPTLRRYVIKSRSLSSLLNLATIASLKMHGRLLTRLQGCGSSRSDGKSLEMFPVGLDNSRHQRLLIHDPMCQFRALQITAVRGSGISGGCLYRNKDILSLES